MEWHSRCNLISCKILLPISWNSLDHFPELVVWKRWSMYCIWLCLFEEWKYWISIWCWSNHNLLPETCAYPFRVDESKETKTDPTTSVHSLTPATVLDRYKPLILPPIFHAFLENHYLYLPRFDGECNKITAERHMHNFETFLDLFEVDEEDVNIRLFSLYFQGKVKSWFKNLPAANMSDFLQFIKVFLDKWVVKENPFLILEEYNQLKRQQGETVQ